MTRIVNWRHVSTVRERSNNMTGFGRLSSLSFTLTLPMSVSSKVLLLASFSSLGSLYTIPGQCTIVLTKLPSISSSSLVRPSIFRKLRTTPKNRKKQPSPTRWPSKLPTSMRYEAQNRRASIHRPILRLLLLLFTTLLTLTFVVFRSLICWRRCRSSSRSPEWVRQISLAVDVAPIFCICGV